MAARVIAPDRLMDWLSFFSHTSTKAYSTVCKKAHHPTRFLSDAPLTPLKGKKKKRREGGGASYCDQEYAIKWSWKIKKCLKGEWKWRCKWRGRGINKEACENVWMRTYEKVRWINASKGKGKLSEATSIDSAKEWEEGKRKWNITEEGKGKKEKKGLALW